MSEHDFMPLDGWDHLEVWVGNAKQAAYFYENAYGFTRTAYAGPETGVRDRASYVLEQGDIRFVLTSGLRSDSEICRWAATKGDSVRDVALAVPDATNAYRQAVQRGARGVDGAALGRGRPRPRRARDDRDLRRQHPHVRQPLRVLRARTSRASGRPRGTAAPLPGVGLITIDHVVGNVELGRMDEWVGFYERVLGFTQLTHFSDEDISTEYSALMSKVMTDGEGKIKFPINEPAEGKRKSQIEEYLEFHGGPGVQHVAMQSDDIVKTVAALREHGVLFITTPDTYYDIVEERVGEIEQDWADLRSMGILADRDEEGYLLQLFTKIVQDRPTLFFEVIERHGSRGFGIGNFKALFEAIEREQALRGNLYAADAEASLPRMSPQRRTALVSVGAAVPADRDQAHGRAREREPRAPRRGGALGHRPRRRAAHVLRGLGRGATRRPGHPFGHGKAQNLAALAEAGFLIAISLSSPEPRSRVSPAGSSSRSRRPGGRSRRSAS